MKPKAIQSIDSAEALSPCVRVVRVEVWDMLMEELSYLRGERYAAALYLQAKGHEDLADDIDYGLHRGEEAE